MNHNYRISFALILSSCIISFSLMQPAKGAFRDVQFKTIDFENSVIELHNFGDTAEPFTNWRFCSHDDDTPRRYSTSGALNSITLDAGESVFFHFNNDAPGGSTNAFNIAGLGNFAGPLDQGPYSINLYVNSAFASPAAMVDHVQWNINGADATTADARSVTAEDADLWTDDTMWVSTTADTLRLELLLEDGAPISGIHGPASYDAIEPVLISPADFDLDGDVDGNDLATLTSAYGSNSDGDVDFDADTDGTDFVLWQQFYTGPTGVAAVSVPEPSTLATTLLGMLLLPRRRRQ